MKPTTPKAAFLRPTFGLGHSAALFLLALTLAQAVNARGMPTGGTVLQGSARITTVGPNSTTVTQTSPGAVINYETFNVRWTQKSLVDNSSKTE